MIETEAGPSKKTPGVLLKIEEVGRTAELNVRFPNTVVL
jgi:hypothetical protein